MGERMRRWWRNWQFDIDQWLFGAVMVGLVVFVALFIYREVRR